MASKHSARHPATSNGCPFARSARTKVPESDAVPAAVQTEPGCACPSGCPRISLTHQDPPRTGALSIVLGALIMPGIGLDLFALALVFGFYAIFLGIFLLAIARRLRQLAQEMAVA